MQSQNKWRHVSEIRKETLDYIIKRHNGTVRSIRTPWQKLNSAIMDGLEWGGIYIWAGRPGEILNLNEYFVKEAANYFNFSRIDKFSSARDRSLKTRKPWRKRYLFKLCPVKIP